MCKSEIGHDTIFRLLNLERLVSTINQKNTPTYINEKNKKEALYLYDIFQKYMLPKKQKS